MLWEYTQLFDRAASQLPYPPQNSRKFDVRSVSNLIIKPFLAAVRLGGQSDFRVKKRRNQLTQQLQGNLLTSGVAAKLF